MKTLLGTVVYEQDIEFVNCYFTALKRIHENYSLLLVCENKNALEHF